jgi:hypothetical protein
MLVKITKAYRDIVTVCDSNLLGKKFEEGKFQLDIKENFFNGEKLSKEKTIKIMQNMLKNDAIFNIVGKKSVNAALKAKIISQEGIKKIQGIEFALILL